MAFGVDDAVLAAGVQAAGSAIAAGTSAVASGKLNKKTMRFNRVEAEKQRQWNEAMADKQNAWNYDMWLKQNEYNSPAAQVQRMRDAGLNPLFYGLDGSTAGELTAAQPLGYERAELSHLENPVANGLAAAAQIAQISNIRADTAMKNNENQSETVRREQMLQAIVNAKQQLENMKSQKGLTDKQVEELDKRISWIDRLNEAAVSSSEASQELSQEQKKRIETLLDGEKILQSKSIEDFEHKWAKIHEEIKKMSAETDILVEDLENYSLNHMQGGFMGTGFNLVNLFRGGNRLSKTFRRERDAGNINGVYSNDVGIGATGTW